MVRLAAAATSAAIMPFTLDFKMLCFECPERFDGLTCRIEAVSYEFWRIVAGFDSILVLLFIVLFVLL